jgi:cAMP-dependent protein kinase regulator
VVPKDEATKAHIKSTVGGNLLFQALEPAQLEAVVLSMEEVALQQGEAIITQGDEGDHFYVVDRRRTA